MCRIIIFLLSLPLCFQACIPKSAQDDQTQRPNIIFIMSDDHAYQAISAYDDRLIQTPNIDRIADQGMLFTNACVTNSICAPSRAVILTGKHSHLNGKIDNIFPFDTTNITFPQIMQEAGYQTAMFGKLHFGNNPKGVDDFMILPGQGHYINPTFITAEGDTTITGYVTDIITDLTLGWLKENAPRRNPLCYATYIRLPIDRGGPGQINFRNSPKKNSLSQITCSTTTPIVGPAAKTAEMNLLNHMMYSHDSKVRPETIEAMGSVQPEVKEFRNSSTGHMEGPTPNNRLSTNQYWIKSTTISVPTGQT